MNKLRFLQNTLALSAAALIIIVWSVVIYTYQQNKQLFKQTKTISSKITPTTDQTVNWNIYDSALFSFRYPQYLTINNTNNGIYLIEGPTDEKNSDYFFGLTSSDQDSRYQPIFETKVDNKKTLIKTGTVNNKGYPLLNRIEVVIENVRFYKEGDWFDNGTMYLFFRINGDTNTAQKTAYAVLDTFKFKAFADGILFQNATLNRLEFKLPVTWWYGCRPTKLYHLCHIDTISNVRPNHPAQFFLQYFPAGQTVFPLIETGILTDVKEKNIYLSGFSGTLVEGRVDPEKYSEGSNIYIQNDIVRMLDIKTPEGIYTFSGVVTKDNLMVSYDQILSTFKFIENSKGSISTSIQLPDKLDWEEVPKDKQELGNPALYLYNSNNKSVEAELNGKEWIAYSEGRFDILEEFTNNLYNTGWRNHLPAQFTSEIKFSTISATGPTGGILGYFLFEGNKMKVINVSENFPNFEYRIFISDTITDKELLSLIN